MRTLKGVLPHDTLSHHFLINCNALSHNFYQKRTPCRIIFTVKGHPVEWHIPLSQVWEYPTPGERTGRNNIGTCPTQSPLVSKMFAPVSLFVEKFCKVGGYHPPPPLGPPPRTLMLCQLYVYIKIFFRSTLKSPPTSL